MATILNTCKAARRRIKSVEDKIDQAVVMWNILEGERSIGGLRTDKAEAIKGDVKELMGILEVIDKELEKDSDVRQYYNSVYKKCEDFWNIISKPCR